MSSTPESEATAVEEKAVITQEGLARLVIIAFARELKDDRGVITEEHLAAFAVNINNAAMDHNQILPIAESTVLTSSPLSGAGAEKDLTEEQLAKVKSFLKEAESIQKQFAKATSIKPEEGNKFFAPFKNLVKKIIEVVAGHRQSKLMEKIISSLDERSFIQKLVANFNQVKAELKRPIEDLKKFNVTKAAASVKKELKETVDQVKGLFSKRKPKEVSQSTKLSKDDMQAMRLMEKRRKQVQGR